MVIIALGALAIPIPTELMAATVNEYSTPGDNPVMDALTAVEPVLLMKILNPPLPPVCTIILYEVIGLPLEEIGLLQARVNDVCVTLLVVGAGET